MSALLLATALLIPLAALPSAAAPPGPASRASTGLAVAPPVAAAAPPSASEKIQGTLDDGTRTVSFNDDWRFALVNSEDITDPTGAFANAADPAFDDAAWDAVKLPHDWSIGLDPVAGAGTDSGTGFLQGGLGWYRKTFTLPQADAGKQLSLEFDGVYMDSSVYVNGTLAAAHPYGYTGFSVDLTTLAHTGATPNVIAVKVQNKLPEQPVVLR